MNYKNSGWYGYTFYCDECRKTETGCDKHREIVRKNHLTNKE